jgi:N-acetylneuraminic acid mutarotase
MLAGGGSEAPAAREDHTWTVDAAGGAAYLFGGRDGATTFDDLWRYDLATDEWAAMKPGGKAPAARFGHTGTWVDGIGLVVWSGQAGSTFYDDIWAYDPAADAWKELPNGGERPLSRYGSCAALGPDGGLWISHGFTSDEGRFFDTRVYDFTTGKWTDVTPAETPVLRCLHDCLWTPDGRFLLYGGQTTGAPAIGDLWSLEPAADAPGTWTQLPKPEPEARQSYALASEGGRAYVFGGGDAKRQELDDLWTLDLGSGTWTELEPEGDRPGGRSGAALVSDPARGRLLLFGGTAGGAGLAELWALSLP